MFVAEGVADETREPQVATRPVMVDHWAEEIIELARGESRRRHPSNREPAWQKDGGYESTEWAS